MYAVDLEMASSGAELFRGNGNSMHPQVSKGPYVTNTHVKPSRTQDRHLKCQKLTNERIMMPCRTDACTTIMKHDFQTRASSIRTSRLNWLIRLLLEIPNPITVGCLRTETSEFRLKVTVSFKAKSSLLLSEFIHTLLFSFKLYSLATVTPLRYNPARLRATRERAGIT